MRQHNLKALREAIGRALKTEGEPLPRSRCPSGIAGTRAIRLAFALPPSDRPAAVGSSTGFAKWATSHLKTIPRQWVTPHQIVAASDVLYNALREHGRTAFRRAARCGLPRCAGR